MEATLCESLSLVVSNPSVFLSIISVWEKSMASGGSADSSTSAGGPSAAGARTGRPGRRKRPRSQSSASLDDQTTRLQEEDFTW